MADWDDEMTAGLADPALASFVLLAQSLGVSADAEQIHHDRGQGDRPYHFDDLIRIAKKLGLIARRKQASLGDLAKLPLPALVRLNRGGTAILLKIDDSGESSLRYKVLPADGQRAEVWSEADVTECLGLAGDQFELLLMTRVPRGRGRGIHHNANDG